MYKTVISRPLPDSKIRKFGEWITAESWENISLEDEPSEQVKVFEEKVTQKLNEIFPKKITKIGIEDQSFMTSELKALKRRRMREYKLKGKTAKYERLLAEFEAKFKKAGQNF